uniref:SMB domain-containing protein n=1 Tax=Strix occidentalis caurina TaxID=311401 RepID=A0A8D0FNY8_STROC
MRLLFPALVLALLATARAAEDSCVGRCEDGFNALHKCQCDTLCMYYQSCCSDYSTVCKAKGTGSTATLHPHQDLVTGSVQSCSAWEQAAPAPRPRGRCPGLPRTNLLPPAVTRGDVFALPEDEYLDYNLTVPSTTPDGFGEQDTVKEPEELCSRKPFDAFTDLKNGSLYAFRGKYFYELDETSVRPGYPKLISDVWGIEGPIDAAFTRINCQGKTYLFKGSEYWRFDDGVLDPGYPRSIAEGFEGIPNNVDAAFALPAHSYYGNERVYFFKDKYYWSYDFAHQPTQADCEKSSPSTVFKHYAFMNRDSWEDIFQILFGGRTTGASSPRYISKDWRGVPSQLDAAMAGRIYVTSHQPRRRKSRRQRKRYKSHRSLNLGFWSWLQNDSDSAGVESDWLSGSQCETLQSVYFFVGGESGMAGSRRDVEPGLPGQGGGLLALCDVAELQDAVGRCPGLAARAGSSLQLPGRPDSHLPFLPDKYYRVNLRTKRVDLVQPRYPRSIAQYWLDCPQPGEEST